MHILYITGYKYPYFGKCHVGASQDSYLDRVRADDRSRSGFEASHKAYGVERVLRVLQGYKARRFLYRAWKVIRCRGEGSTRRDLSRLLKCRTKN